MGFEPTRAEPNGLAVLTVRQVALTTRPPRLYGTGDSKMIISHSSIFRLCEFALDRQARDASPSCADFVWGPSQKSSVTKDCRSLRKSSCHQGLLRFPLVELLSNYGKRMIPILSECLPPFP
ncbi:hypothetical protein CDAR_540951 [Caerostris darwini]|uniref:Uncharacterized protein n=1 Tax=Caerostris darwini TaxID=1538125 RepID=A0AAV4VIC3_9ARAC|nr:hypothetical protein CDAR_540951 [Caerostris darwini]